MLPHVPKYVRPEEIAASKARMRSALIWIAFSIPALFVFLAWGYSDGAPAGLRNAIVTLDRSLGYPIIGLLSMILG
jgi:hypothetical protein